MKVTTAGHVSNQVDIHVISEIKYCCTQLSLAMIENVITYNRAIAEFRIASNTGGIYPISHCPFCGSKIVIVNNK